MRTRITPQGRRFGLLALNGALILVTVSSFLWKMIDEGHAAAFLQSVEHSIRHSHVSRHDLQFWGIVLPLVLLFMSWKSPKHMLLHLIGISVVAVTLYTVTWGLWWAVTSWAAAATARQNELDRMHNAPSAYQQQPSNNRQQTAGNP